MRRPWIICELLLLTFFADVRYLGSQTNTAAAQSVASYSFKVSVDEVGLTFHAVDVHGLAVNDLQLNELSILDNGKPPRKILVFQSLTDLPIRAGILMDKSDSMEESLFRNRAISIEYAQRLLRQQTDQAFVMDFAALSEVVQPWTSNAMELTAGIRRFTAYGGTHLRGTAIFDALYRACRNQFGKIDNANSGNLILLFSDGEDNASRASLEETVDSCQHANTAIYVFRTEPHPRLFSTGPRTLAELTSKTGGRVFYADDPDAGIYNDLRIIEGDLRNQYRLVYKPAELKYDGSFHRIELKASERVDNISIRSGYYAPAR